MKLVDSFFSYCESFLNLEQNTADRKEYKLERMQRMLEAAHNPHQGLNIIHVAGSKGKGSTVISIAQVLSQTQRVGVFLSPHIEDYRERMQILHEDSPDPFILEASPTIRRIAQQVGNPTTFELLTLTAFLVFQLAGCEWVVLETGLGGRLDCTNVVNPRLSIITSIEKEHCDYLGYTMEEIAFEKGGIIKRGVPVILGNIQESARTVLCNIARERQSEVFAIDEWVQSIPRNITANHTEIFLRLLQPIGNTEKLHGEGIIVRSKLLGRVQAYTAAMALLAVLIVKKGKFSFPFFRKGLSQAYLPGRMDRISEEPPLFFDGAHTPDSISQSLYTFFHLFPQGGKIIFSCIQGKNVEAMAQQIISYTQQVVITSPGKIRPSDPLRVNEIMQHLSMSTTFIPDPVEAVKRTRQEYPDAPILVTGSFYLIATLWKQRMALTSAIGQL